MYDAVSFIPSHIYLYNTSSFNFFCFVFYSFCLYVFDLYTITTYCIAFFFIWVTLAIYISINGYVCMYLCMYIYVNIYIYLCMYIYMSICIHIFNDHFYFLVSEFFHILWQFLCWDCLWFAEALILGGNWPFAMSFFCHVWLFHLWIVYL